MHAPVTVGAVGAAAAFRGDPGTLRSAANLARKTVGFVRTAPCSCERDRLSRK